MKTGATPIAGTREPVRPCVYEQENTNQRLREDVHMPRMPSIVS